MAILTTKVKDHAINVTKRWPNRELSVLGKLASGIQMLVMSVAIIAVSCVAAL